MATKKQYWLITYRQRQNGESEADASYYMKAIDTSIAAWVEKVMMQTGSDCVLINQAPLTASEFKNLEGNVL